MAKQFDLATFWGKQRRNSSKIWNHFGFHKDASGKINKTVAVCKYCNAELKYQQGSTTNLKYHYNNFHYAASSQPSIASSFGQPKKYPKVGMRHMLLQKSVVEFLIDDLRPFLTVDSPSFIRMVNNLDPRFQLESAKVFSNMIIPKMYSDICMKVKELLKPVATIGITSDSWTSAATQSYVTMTGHFIDEEWLMKSLCLQTRHCPESHTAEHLKEIYLDAFVKWELENKDITGCVDNARNVNSWQLLSRLCMLCFGHTINLSVKKGLSVDGTSFKMQKIGWPF